MKSALEVLKRAKDDIEIIPTRQGDGITIFAFALKKIIGTFGFDVAEMAMDSTCELTRLLLFILL